MLEFHGDTKIYVPASKIELVQKYVGGNKQAGRTLAHIGGRMWVRQKEAAARGRHRPGRRHARVAGRARPAAGHRVSAAIREWQREFDASFPYLETPDQLTSIAAIKADMEQPRPMDRLLCGDVGFGKTELAMRAAFKVVDSGYQVAVLVPTTILAEQHLRTFRARMAEFPFSDRRAVAVLHGQGNPRDHRRAGRAARSTS